MKDNEPIKPSIEFYLFLAVFIGSFLIIFLLIISIVCHNIVYAIIGIISGALLIILGIYFAERNNENTGE